MLSKEERIKVAEWVDTYIGWATEYFDDDTPGKLSSVSNAAKRILEDKSCESKG